jgi:hypothetical protein
LRIYARLSRDIWGGIDWILHDDGLQHPLAVITDSDMELLFKDVKNQREMLEHNITTTKKSSKKRM